MKDNSSLVIYGSICGCCLLAVVLFFLYLVWLFYLMFSNVAAEFDDNYSYSDYYDYYNDDYYNDYYDDYYWPDDYSDQGYYPEESTNLPVNQA